MKKLASTGAFNYFLRQDGIILSTLREKKVIDVTDIKASLGVCRDLSQDLRSKLIILSDIQDLKGMSREARQFSQTKGVGTFEDYIQATGLLVKSGLSKMIGNFLIGLNRSSYPTRLFTEEQLAANWLIKFK